METNQVLEGDCLEVMKTFPDNSITGIVTDPPYGLTFMGKDWDKGVPGERFWREMLRIAKPGSHLMAFGGTRTYHRLACAIEDAGWVIRDCMMWLYGSGFPKSYDISKGMDKALGKSEEREVVETRQAGSSAMMNLLTCNAKNKIYSPSMRDYRVTAPASDEAKHWNGYGTALKPAWEPIILAMKPVEDNFVKNAMKWGLAGLAIDACRIPTGDNLGSFGGGIISWHRLNHLHGRLSDEAMEQQEKKPRSWIDNSGGKGRWPANLILSHHLDCTEEKCSLDCPMRILDAQSGPMKSNLTVVSGRGGTGNVYAIPKKTPSLHGYIDSGGASRFFWTAKASRSERRQFNIHPTVKPVALMQYLVKLILPPDGGIILDPFLGSGTTAVACQSIGVEFLGIELDPKYVNIARARLLQEKPKHEPAKEEEPVEGIQQGGLFD